MNSCCSRVYADRCDDTRRGPANGIIPTRRVISSFSFPNTPKYDQTSESRRRRWRRNNSHNTFLDVPLINGYDVARSRTGTLQSLRGVKVKGLSVGTYLGTGRGQLSATRNKNPSVLYRNSFTRSLTFIFLKKFVKKRINLFSFLSGSIKWRFVISLYVWTLVQTGALTQKALRSRACAQRSEIVVCRFE